MFLRGVNVGGHKAFRPSAVAGQLADLGVTSVGAAGTFVVHADVEEGEIRRVFRKNLPFDAHVMVSPARELARLVDLDPFADDRSARADGCFVSVLESRLRARPRLPLEFPEGADWQVAITAIHGRFVLTLFRRLGRNPLYPNAVVEKRFGVPATTRGWPTILKVRRALESAPASGAGTRGPRPRR